MEAERFSEMADVLARRMASLADKGDPAALDRIGVQYRQVNLGVDTNLGRAAAHSQVIGQKLKENVHARKVTIDNLLARIPPAVQRTLRDALEGHSKTSKSASKGQKKKGGR